MLPRAALLVVVALAGCVPARGFVCKTGGDCAQSGGPGTCELPPGFCAFHDPSCTTGKRFGRHAGDYSGQCVGVVDDGGMIHDVLPLDAPMPDAALTRDG